MEVRSFSIALAAAIVSLLVIPGVAETAPASSCASGPEREGATIVGTPCDDTIVVPSGVAAVEAGPGDDTIVPAPISSASAPCPAGCHLGIGSQTYDGGPGDDVVFGERGNDVLEGGEGDDQLFGGIGDDLLRGGGGNDRLAGGFGNDAIDGQGGDDYVRADTTVDTIVDSGGGTDTLSYSTGVTPGFFNSREGYAYPTFSDYAGVPPLGGVRGVFLDLGQDIGDNGVAALGGGSDEVEGSAFETIVGTAFADFIVGTTTSQTIYGGGGGDVILGGGGSDQVRGGVEGDRCDAGSGSSDCETPSGPVVQRDPTKIAVGLMTAGAGPYAQLYLTGSSGRDVVSATYSGAAVTFTLGAASAGGFDATTVGEGGCGAPSGGEVTCPLAAPLDSLIMAGLDGDDELRAEGFPDRTAVLLTGGAGGDLLGGGAASEDILVDGAGDGDDDSSALGGDDALTHNGGADALLGGEGNDLFLSNSVCDQNSIDGGGGRDNASWAQLDPGAGESGVAADVGAGVAGFPNGDGPPACPGGALDGFVAVEDLEGSRGDDVLYGGAEANQLLGRPGADVYHAAGGGDRILANSGDDDPVIDCGPDPGDVALIDRRPQHDDAIPVECETVAEAEPNSFQIPTELPPGTPPPDGGEASPPPPARPLRPDTRPPRTRLLHRPRSRLLALRLPRRIVVRFASSEPGSRFRCRLDRRRFRACASPLAIGVGRGRHTVRVVAIDRAGNADPTPAAFRFVVERRSRR